MENSLKKWSLIILLLIWTLWLGATLAIDLLAIPSVFSVSDDMFEAGKIGLIVFGKFNQIEVVLGFISFLFGIIFMVKRTPFSKFFISLGFFLFLIPLIYSFKFTPKISHYAGEMERLSKLYSPKSQLKYEKVAEDHHFYHTWYIRTDGVKILFLLGGIVLTCMAQREREEIIFKKSLEKKEYA